MFLVASCSRITDPEEEINESAGIDKELCISSGGNWNECSSPCLGTDSEVCIDVCVVQCECGGIAGFNCPKDYKCRLAGKIADELGVCYK